MDLEKNSKYFDINGHSLDLKKIYIIKTTCAWFQKMPNDAA